MTTDLAASLRKRLAADARADMGSLQTHTDRELSIGAAVWRLRWDNQVATAVAADADLHTTCGALLDAIALLESTADIGLDRTTVNVLIDRCPPDDHLAETDQALRSLRDSTVGIVARLWYRNPSTGWVEDVGLSPRWPKGTARVVGWVDHLQIPRLMADPAGLAVELVAKVGDPSLQLYPSEIAKPRTDAWALRIDGLQIGIAFADHAVLEIGKEGRNGDGPQRATFTKVFGSSTIHVSADPVAGSHTVSVEEAATKIRELLRAFRTVDVVGAPISHRAPGGVAIVDEHALEARLLKGLVELPESQLVHDDRKVARGSQFPTLWGVSSRPRYVDALLRRGRTPLAVELKVATGGQGRYYRRSIIQAVLYSHYIKNAADLDPWFNLADLDRNAVRACIGVPIPARWTDRFNRDLELLRAVAARVGTEVHVLDDRVTPERISDGTGDECVDERLRWSLAASLSTRYPSALGRVIEVHGAGGLYDELQLRSPLDFATHSTSPFPRVHLNMPGSLRVFNQCGDIRWVWRGIWAYLAGVGDPDLAADTVAGIAGLGSPAAEPAVGFATLAKRFLQRFEGNGWSWRCAFSEGRVAAWADAFPRYSRDAAAGALPAIVRLWGAQSGGVCRAVVDQDTLRVWVRSDEGFEELVDSDPIKRIETAASECGGV
jgi:hypothetical protein